MESTTNELEKVSQVAQPESSLLQTEIDEDECPELVSAKVPVTILTGFLGSGKTTLLHYVLTAAHEMKIAVIVNEFEFGKSIEKGLTVQSSNKSDDEWIELSNGCMCCSAHTQTIKALESLIARKGTFDLILVETAGLADPAPVAAMFWQDSAVCGIMYLSGIVTLVDAVHITHYLQDSDVAQEAHRQILVADKIILNKCDIATVTQMEEAMHAVHEINPVAELFKTSFARIDNLQNILFIDTTNTFPELTHLHNTFSSTNTTTNNNNNDNNIDNDHEADRTTTHSSCNASSMNSSSALQSSSSSSSSLSEYHSHKCDANNKEEEESITGNTITNVNQNTSLCTKSHLHKLSTKNVSVLTLEFGSSRAPLFMNGKAEVESICKELLYRDDKYNFEVIRCKAALWQCSQTIPGDNEANEYCTNTEYECESDNATHAKSEGKHSFNTNSVRLLQLQSIGLCFDITEMAGASVPVGCNRVLILGKQLDEEVIQNIFMTYLHPLIGS